MSPLVILQNDGLLSLFTDCTASDSMLSNSERFSCANSSESFLEEFILKDTFSILIKCSGLGTACNSGSLKMCFLEMFMLRVWAQCVPVGILSWLIVLSIFIYGLFGTSSTPSLCDQDWANLAADWTLRLLQQTQQSQPGLGHDSQRSPLTSSKPGHLTPLFYLISHFKWGWLRSPGMAEHHGFLVGLKGFVCTDVGPSPPMSVYWEQAVSLVHIWIYIPGTQDRSFLFLKQFHFWMSFHLLEGLLVWLWFLNCPLKQKSLRFSVLSHSWLDIIHCALLHWSHLRNLRKQNKGHAVTQAEVFCVLWGEPREVTLKLGNFWGQSEDKQNFDNWEKKNCFGTRTRVASSVHKK